MLYPMEFFDRCKCSRNEKKECIPVISRILSFSDKARREGLLALEEDLDAIQDPFFQKGLQLVIDGTDPELVQEILYTMMLSGHYRGIDLLARAIMITGILGIQSGDNPRILFEKLTAYLGRDANLLDQAAVLDQTLVPDDSGDIQVEGVPSPVNALVEGLAFETLAGLRDIFIQKILREVDTQELAKALKGGSGLVREKFFGNMAQRAALLLKEDMQYMGPIRREDVEESQVRILRIALKLSRAGEIIIDEGSGLVG